MIESYTVYWIRKYAHKNKFIDGYIGISVDPYRRLKEHYKGKSKVSRIINADVNKDNIELVILHTDLPKINALILEEKYRPEDNIGWNQIKGGGMPPSSIGRVRTEESKNKIRGDNNPAKKQENRDKISKSLKGKPKDYLLGKKRPEHGLILSKYKGESYPKFKGWFITPWGRYSRYIEAVNSAPYKININSLYNWCVNNNNKTISKQAIAKNTYLKYRQSQDGILGDTFKDIGFGFEYKK